MERTIITEKGNNYKEGVTIETDKETYIESTSFFESIDDFGTLREETIRRIEVYDNEVVYENNDEIHCSLESHIFTSTDKELIEEVRNFIKNVKLRYDELEEIEKKIKEFAISIRESSEEEKEIERRREEINEQLEKTEDEDERYEIIKQIY